MQKKYLIYFIFLTLIFFSSTTEISFSQRNVEGFDGNFKKLFTEAESYFLYEDYAEALYLYRLLKREFANNKKYDYRIGLCYLNMHGQKQKAIPFLKNATEAVYENCREHLYRESCVPVDVHFYLGDAYRINNQLDKSIESYQKFIELANKEEYDLLIVKQEIEACKRAKESIDNPKPIQLIQLNENVNTGDHFNPVFSADGNTLVFASEMQFYTAVFYTTKNDEGTWNTPINIIPHLEFDDNIYPSSLNGDGTELYLCRLDDYGGDVYFSKLENEKWSPAKKLDAPVNSRFWESHASISPDGNTLYFSSNRNEGYGGLDIYKTTKEANGKWSEPKNLGATINTERDEHTPFICDNEKTLYFSSRGHNSIGGFDIFRSEKTNSEWSSPVNLSYPLNTTDDDIFFHPAPHPDPDNIIGYVFRINPQKGIQRNLYKVKSNSSF